MHAEHLSPRTLGVFRRSWRPFTGNFTIARSKHCRLRGHDQIEDLLHRPSNTLENLFRTDPLLAVTVLGDQVVSRPAAFFAFVLFVLPIEITTTWLAHRDRAEGLRYDHAWNPVE